MAPTTMTDEPSSLEVKGSPPLWKTALLAAVLAAALNAVIFALSVAAGVFSSFTFQPELGAQMFFAPVLLVSFVGAVAGVGAFGLLRNRVAEPATMFLRIAAAVLLLSFAAPFAAPGTSMVQGMVLNLMHVVVAAVVVWAVLRTVRK